MRIFKFLLILLLSLMIISCGSSLLPELTIKNFSYDKEKITVEFSDTPTQISVQESFSLTEDEVSVSGIYKFSGNTVSYYPENGIQDNYDYIFMISNTCETADGNSLSEQYVVPFSTRNELVSPKIVSITPCNEEICENNPEYIEIIFSEPIDTLSFEKAFQITPEIDYFAEFSGTESSVRLILNDNLEVNKDYQIDISTELRDKCRNNLIKDFNSTFSLVKKYSSPDIKCTVYNEKNFSCECEKKHTVASVPLDSKIKFEFDTSMSFSSLSSYISVIPTLTFNITKDEINNKYFVLSLSNVEWGKNYEIDISNKLTDIYSNSIGDNISYSFIFDNESYRLPDFIEGYLQTGIWTDTEIPDDSYKIISSETNFGYIKFDGTKYSIGEDCEATLYLVFSSSKNSEGLNLYSLLDKFSISCTNSCISCVIKNVSKISDFNLLAFPFSKLCSTTVKESTLKLSIIKFDLEITNANNNGIIQFDIDSGYKDTLGNISSKDYTYKYNK